MVQRNREAFSSLSEVGVLALSRRSTLLLVLLASACTGDDSMGTTFDTTRGMVLTDTDDSEGGTTTQGNRGVTTSTGTEGMTEGSGTDSEGSTTTTGTTAMETGGQAPCNPNDGMACNLNGYCGLVDEVCHCDKGFDGDFCDECDVKNGYNPNSYPNCELIDVLPPADPFILDGEEMGTSNDPEIIKVLVDSADTKKLLFNIYKFNEEDDKNYIPVEPPYDAKNGDQVATEITLPTYDGIPYEVCYIAEDANGNKSAKDCIEVTGIF